MQRAADHAELISLGAEVRDLHAALVAAEAQWHTEIEAAHPAHRASAANLVHYVELRNHDVRELQGRLAVLGISSLGRSEPHVLATIESVLSVLGRLSGEQQCTHHVAVSFSEGQDLLDRNTERLLGAPPASRSTRIMVTLPSEAADRPDLVTRLASNGMDIARVNCAHDDEAAWARMVRQVRAITTPDGRACRVAMDLAGPKLRTGPIEPLSLIHISEPTRPY